MDVSCRNSRSILFPVSQRLEARETQATSEVDRNDVPLQARGVQYTLRILAVLGVIAWVDGNCEHERTWVVIERLYNLGFAPSRQ